MLRDKVRSKRTITSGVVLELQSHYVRQHSFEILIRRR